MARAHSHGCCCVAGEETPTAPTSRASAPRAPDPGAAVPPCRRAAVRPCRDRKWSGGAVASRLPPFALASGPSPLATGLRPRRRLRTGWREAGPITPSHHAPRRRGAPARTRRGGLPLCITRRHRSWYRLAVVRLVVLRRLLSTTRCELMPQLSQVLRTPVSNRPGSPPSRLARDPRGPRGRRIRRVAPCGPPGWRRTRPARLAASRPRDSAVWFDISLTPRVSGSSCLTVPRVPRSVRPRPSTRSPRSPRSASGTVTSLTPSRARTHSSDSRLGCAFAPVQPRRVLDRIALAVSRETPSHRGDRHGTGRG